MMVLLLGIFYHPTEAVYTAVEITPVVTTRDVVYQFVEAFPDYTNEVIRSMLPVIGVLVVFQILTKNYRKRQLLRMAIGFVYTIVGLILFLTGVNIGFARLVIFLELVCQEARLNGSWFPLESSSVTIL